jgi:hypothetical protein
MRWLGAAACVPIMAKQDLCGILVLGPKKNQAIYNEEDKKFLSHVAEMISSPIHTLSDTFVENTR